MKFGHQISGEPTTHRAWDRRILLFLLYNATFWAKLAKNEHYALIGARWGEKLLMGARQKLALYDNFWYSSTKKIVASI